MTMEDLKSYKAVERQPVTSTFLSKLSSSLEFSKSVHTSIHVGC